MEDQIQLVAGKHVLLDKNFHGHPKGMMGEVHHILYDEEGQGKTIEILWKGFSRTELFYLDDEDKITDCLQIILD